MKDHTDNDPSFSDIVKILETTDTNNASNFNITTERLLANDLCLKDSAAGKEVGQKLLTAGQTELIFEVQGLKENSRIEVYTSDPNAEYTSLTVSEDNITVNFIPLTKNIYVKVVIYDELVQCKI